jgi:hypothetical protein
MEIKSVKVAKSKAQVIQSFLKEHNIKLDRSNALHLIARLEEVENWQALKTSLEQLDAPRRNRVTVTLLDATRQTPWHFTNNITDRWGELNDHAWDSKPEGHVLENDENLLQRLLSQMLGEESFVAAKDGKLGILVEIEYYSQESEADSEPEDLGEQEFRPYDEVVERIKRLHLPLKARFPKVQFCVPDRDEVIMGRPAIWAFFEDGALTEAEREALHTALVDIAYPK